MPKCIALTRKGVPCRNNASGGGELCGVHIRTQGATANDIGTVLNLLINNSDFMGSMGHVDGVLVQSNGTTLRLTRVQLGSNVSGVPTSSVPTSSAPTSNSLAAVPAPKSSGKPTSPSKLVTTDPVKLNALKEISQCFASASACKTVMERGLDDKHIDLYITQYSSALARAESLAFCERKCMEPTDCPICLDTKVEFVQLLCGHEFCRDCINASLNVTRNRCSLCKRNCYTLREQEEEPKIRVNLNVNGRGAG